MGAMARRKGQRGEREIVDLLQAVVNEVYSRVYMTSTEHIPLLQRNTLQSDRGGYDIVGLDWLAPEVKRCETLNLKEWWLQCKAQAKPHQTPVLFYRSNGQKWRVRMLGYLTDGLGYCQSLDQTTAPLPRRVRVLVDISMDSFLVYFRARLENELREGHRT